MSYRAESELCDLLNAKILWLKQSAVAAAAIVLHVTINHTQGLPSAVVFLNAAADRSHAHG